MRRNRILRTVHAVAIWVWKKDLARMAKSSASQTAKRRYEVAEAILRGDDLDVIEIDGASAPTSGMASMA